MANTFELRGIQMIDGTVEGFSLSDLTNKHVLYFVRTDENKENGYLYFNGKKYGVGGNGEITIDTIDCGTYEGQQ